MTYPILLVFLVIFLSLCKTSSWMFNKVIESKKNKLLSATLSVITLSTLIHSGSLQVKADDIHHHHHHQHRATTFFVSDNTDKMSSFSLVRGIIIKELQEPPSEIFRDAIDAIKDASIPANVGSLLALSAAEALSGAVGALSSRQMATFLNDKKKDSDGVKALSTSLFFGTRSILRTSCRLVGLPRPLSIVVAALVASLISEALKVGSRIQIAKSTNVSESSSPLNEYIDNDEKEIISGKEIGSDISKWLIYDGLSEVTRLPFFSDNNYHLLLPAVYALNGGFSSLLSSYIKITGTDKASNQKRVKEIIEGAILFLFYEEFQEILLYLGKGTFLDQKFMFDEVIEKIEDIVEEDMEMVEKEIQSPVNWFKRN